MQNINMLLLLLDYVGKNVAFSMILRPYSPS